MILIIDNFDSFTYNLYQQVAKLTDVEILVKRNNEITIEEISQINPSGIILSPGPGHPATERDFGIGADVLRELSPKIPTLGVCLGHQGIGHVYKGKVISAKNILHGKQSYITHDGSELFKGIPQRFLAGRYHSLAIDQLSLPDDLIITATADDNEVMSIKHLDYPIYGIQFHPESILTKYGSQIVENFLSLS